MKSLYQFSEGVEERETFIKRFSVDDREQQVQESLEQALDLFFSHGDAEGNTVFHYAAINPNDSNVIKKLLAMKDRASQYFFGAHARFSVLHLTPNHIHLCPIHYACFRGLTHNIYSLLSHNTDELNQEYLLKLLKWSRHLQLDINTLLQQQDLNSTDRWKAFYQGVLRSNSLFGFRGLTFDNLSENIKFSYNFLKGKASLKYLICEVIANQPSNSPLHKDLADGLRLGTIPEDVGIFLDKNGFFRTKLSQMGEKKFRDYTRWIEELREQHEQILTCYEPCCCDPVFFIDHPFRNPVFYTILSSPFSVATSLFVLISELKMGKKDENTSIIFLSMFKFFLINLLAPCAVYVGTKGIIPLLGYEVADNDSIRLPESLTSKITLLVESGIELTTISPRLRLETLYEPHRVVYLRKIITDIINWVEKFLPHLRMRMIQFAKQLPELYAEPEAVFINMHDGNANSTEDDISDNNLVDSHFKQS